MEHLGVICWTIPGTLARIWRNHLLRAWWPKFLPSNQYPLFKYYWIWIWIVIDCLSLDSWTFQEISQQPFKTGLVIITLALAQLPGFPINQLLWQTAHALDHSDPPNPNRDESNLTSQVLLRLRDFSFTARKPLTIQDVFVTLPVTLSY